MVRLELDSVDHTLKPLIFEQGITEKRSYNGQAKLVTCLVANSNIF